MANQTDPTGEGVSSTSDGDSTDPRSFVNSTINDTWSVEEIQAIVLGVLRGIFPEEFLRDPRTYIIGTTVGYLVDTFIYPFFGALATAGTAMITAVLVVFLGSDLSLGATGSLGLADIPLYVTASLIGAGGPVGADLLGFVFQFNAAIAQVAADAGLAAPAIVTLLYGAEALVVIYLLWSLIQVIDVPIIEVSGVVRVVLLPVRKLIGVIR